jgi:hypothetical protein
MSQKQKRAAAERAARAERLAPTAVYEAGTLPGPANRQPPRRSRRYTAVVYEKKRTKTVVLYVGGKPFTLKASAGREINGKIVRRWRIGNTEAYTVRMRAIDVVRLIDAYAHDEAVLRMHLFDPVYREAVRQGYKAHDNELYVKLWLEHPLGEPLFHVGDPMERQLGDCIKHFTNSYGIWRMVTPPWAATC